jgi:hypothetical protein
VRPTRVELDRILITDLLLARDLEPIPDMARAAPVFDAQDGIPGLEEAGDQPTLDE